MLFSDAYIEKILWQYLAEQFILTYENHAPAEEYLFSVNAGHVGKLLKENCGNILNERIHYHLKKLCKGKGLKIENTTKGYLYRITISNNQIKKLSEGKDLP